MPGLKDGWKRVAPGRYGNLYRDRSCEVTAEDTGLWQARVDGEPTPGKWRFQKLELAQQACEQTVRGQRRYRQLTCDEVAERLARQHRISGTDAMTAEIEQTALKAAWVTLANLDLVIAEGVSNAQG